VQSIAGSSVADPGCLSRIPDPDFYPSRIPGHGSRIPDPKTATKERGKKKVRKKKIWANFQRIIELFTKKIVKTLLKIWSWDPGSGIRDPGSGKNLFRIPDPGVKKHPIPDPDPQHWQVVVRWPPVRQARGSYLGPAPHATALRKFQRIAANGINKLSYC
jgi:hypothetical protein